MPRCGCADSCSCLVVAGDGISVEGIGTLERPYEITSESADLIGRVEFTDDGNVDFTSTGVGTLNDPLTVFADAVLSTRDLTDVPDTFPDEGQVLVWRLDHWEYEDQSGGGGSGVPPGGLTGEVLTKLSDADGDADWEPISGMGGAAVVSPTEYVILRAGAIQSMANSTENSIIYAAANSEDPFGLWDGSTLVTIKTAGLYDITYSYGYAANGTGNRITLIKVNGSTTRQWYHTFTAAFPVMGTVSFEAKLNAGDTIQVRQYQSSGASLDTTGTPLAYAPSLFVTKQDVAVEPGGGGVVVERPAAAMRRHATATSILDRTVTAVPWDTEVYTDGITWDGAAFIAPVDGYYDVQSGVTFAANATGSRISYIQVNGVTQTASSSGTGDPVTTNGAVVKALAGQAIRVAVQHTAGVTLALAANASYNWISVVKVPQSYSGSAVSTYGEQNYALSARHAAVLSIPNNANGTIIPFDTIDYADGLSLAAGIFTAPVAGYYQISAKAGFESNTAGFRRIRFITGSSSAVPGLEYSTPSAGAFLASVSMVRTLKMAAGDTLSVQVDHNAGVSLNLGSGVGYTSLDITKVPAPVINGAAASGVWGVSPLSETTQYAGGGALLGREIYIDPNGQLRAKPEEISGTPSKHAVTSLITTYPHGTSVMYVGSVDGGPWPPGTSCVVTTSKTSNHAGLQTCVGNATGTRVWARYGNSNGWQPWTMMADSTKAPGEFRLATNQSIAPSVVTVVNLTAAVPGEFTVAGGAVTVPVDGTYLLTGAVTWAATTVTTGHRYSYIVVNSATQQRVSGGPVLSTPLTHQVGKVLPLLAGDAVTVKSFHTHTASLDLDSTNMQTFLTLARL